MADHRIETTITGGQIQGVAGAGTVVIENFTIYNRAADEPAATGAGPIPACPYPGLAYFGPGDKDLFFGRDAAIARLADAVGRQSLTALVGASGSGKSSVVLAGLAPRLAGAGGWRITHFRIGTELERSPFLALARALVPLYVVSESETERLKNTKQLAANLRAGELTLRDVFADCRSRNKGQHILLIADQFEETFTLVEDEAECHRFIDVLLAGFTDPPTGANPDICLTLTLRADFYGRAVAHRPLADALQGHVENLGPMNRIELREAIVRPAENAKTSFEAGLVETLLDDVKDKPGSLPLLQFALRELWLRQEKREITRKSYNEIGGVEGALAQRAETVFTALTDNGANWDMEKAFLRLFTRLVTLGEGQEDTRRIVGRQELGDSVWSLAQRLANENNRLVVTDAHGPTHETAEVVHEALIRHWPRLVGWINRDRTFQSWLRQIRSNVELWSADPADNGPLLRGGMLAQAMDWLARRRDDLSLAELSLIETSVALRRREEEERDAARTAEIKRQKELAEAAAKLANEERRRADAQRKVIERTRLGLIAASVLAAIIFGLAIFGFYKAREALDQTKVAEKETTSAREATKRMEAALQREAQRRHEAQIAQMRLVANVARRQADVGDFGTAVDLILETLPDGTRGNDRPILLENENDLRTYLASLKELNIVPNAAHFAVRTQGKYVAVFGLGHVLTIWNWTTRSPKLLELPDQAIDGVFSPDGKYLLTLGNYVSLWETETWKKISVLSDQFSLRAIFSPDNHFIVTEMINDIEILSVPDLNKIGRIEVAEGGGALLAYYGDRILLENSAGDVFLWDAGSNTLVTKVSNVRSDLLSSANAAALSDDGATHLAIGYSNGLVELRDGESGLLKFTRQDNAKGQPVTVKFSPGGKRLISMSGDTTTLWNPQNGELIARLPGAYTTSFAPEGDYLFTCPGSAIVGEGTIGHIWNPETGALITDLRGHDSLIRSASFSKSGSRVLTASLDKTARLWNPNTGRLIATLAGNSAPVLEAALIPNANDLLVTLAADKTTRFWDATKRVLPTFGNTQDLINYARATVPRELTSDQRKAFLPD